MLQVSFDPLRFLGPLQFHFQNPYRNLFPGSQLMDFQNQLLQFGIQDFHHIPNVQPLNFLYRIKKKFQLL